MSRDNIYYGGLDDREHYDYCLKTAPKFVFENYPRAEEIDWSFGIETISSGNYNWSLIVYVDAKTHRLTLKASPGDSWVVTEDED